MAGFFSTSKLTQRTSSPSSGISLCGSCGLYKHCRSPKMPPTGKGKKKILIVAEAPGEKEDLKGTQLIGEAGQLLRRLLKELDVDLDVDCWKTNSVICRPRKNATPEHEQIKACSPNVFKAIKEYNPNVIILLGGVSVQSVIGTLKNERLKSRGAWMGWQIPSQELNTWICPTYHPSYLLRMQDSLIERALKQHLKSAIELSGSKPWITIPDYAKEIQIITNPSKAAKKLNHYLEQGGTIAFDYEANCVKPEYEGSELYSCSVCWNDKETIAFPWVGEAVEAMKNLLQSPVAKIGANMKYEDRWTRNKLKTRIRNWIWDTMVAAHVLDNRPGITGLKFQAFVLLGQKSYNDHIQPLLESGANHLNRIHEIDIQDLLLYNGLDSLLTYKVALKQMKLLGKEL